MRFVREAMNEFNLGFAVIPSEEGYTAALCTQIDRDERFPVCRWLHCRLLTLEQFQLRSRGAESIEEMPPLKLHPPGLNDQSYNATVGQQETRWPRRNPWDQSVDASTCASHRNPQGDFVDPHPTKPD